MTGLRTFAHLAREAAEAVRLRQEKYDALVKARGQDQTDLELRVWQAIAGDLHWVVTLDRPAAPSATLREKIDLLTIALGRANHRLNQLVDRAPFALNRACKAGDTVATLGVRFGDSARPILDANEQRDRIEQLLGFYRAEQDCPPSCTMGDLVAIHLMWQDRLSEARARRKAA